MNFDTEYLTRLKQRDSETCTAFVLSLTPLVEARLRSRLFDRGVLEDARNETFLRTFRLVDLGRVRHPERLRAFVFGVCDRVAHEERRKLRYWIPMPDDAIEPADMSPPTDKTMAQCEKCTLLRRVLDRLGEADRRLLIELHFQERDRSQMARERGISCAGLNVRICRALKRLRAEMSIQNMQNSSRLTSAA